VSLSFLQSLKYRHRAKQIEWWENLFGWEYARNTAILRGWVHRIDPKGNIHLAGPGAEPALEWVNYDGRVEDETK
jgi:hypothetical protein